MSDERYVSFGTYLAATVFALDQGVKWFLLESVMSPPKVVPLCPWLNLTLSLNKGVTFGLLNHGLISDGARSVLLIGAAILITILLFKWLTSAETLWATFGLGFVMGGAVGNVADRVRLGAVVDFIDFHIGGWHWYTFNLADSAIVCGVILLAFDHLVMTRKKG